MVQSKKRRNREQAVIDYEALPVDGNFPSEHTAIVAEDSDESSAQMEGSEFDASESRILLRVRIVMKFH